jgi:UDP-N-acetylglucosamine:LPS N-acetylglucosamine transferase
VVLPEERTSSEELSATVTALLRDRGRLKTMGDAARSLGHERPAAAIAALIRERLR